MNLLGLKLKGKKTEFSKVASEKNAMPSKCLYEVSSFCWLRAPCQLITMHLRKTQICVGDVQIF